jgi:putative heme-binding domain-containing protein
MTEAETRQALADEDPFVRAWAVQLACDGKEASGTIQKEFVPIAFDESSPVVRRYLASAIQRVSENTAWGIAENLAKHAEDADDRNLPFLLWHGLASVWSAPDAPAAVEKKRLNTAMTIARETRIPQLSDWIYWYAAALEGESLDRAIAALGELRDEELLKRLTGLWLAMEPRANLPMPKSWKKTAAMLNLNSNAEVRRLSQRLAAVYGDDSSFGLLRETLARFSADPAARAHAFAVLSRAQDKQSLDVFLGLLGEDAFRLQTLRLLARFDSDRIPPAIITRFNFLQPSERSAAIDALTSRASFAIPLLVAVGNDVIPRSALSAFHVRQLSQLNNPEVDRKIAEIWGPIKTTPAQKQAEIERLDTVFGEAPLWAYSDQAGFKHFQTLCAPCHRVGDIGTRLGPELTGAGKHGARYFIENIIDPDAVVGKDFQLLTVETKDGDVIAGLSMGDTPSAVTLLHTGGPVVIPRADIASSVLSDKSMMPEGLLDALNEREKIELLKFLQSH